MIKITNQGIFIFFFLLIIVLIYLLAPILTPFLFGALLAFLMDPIVKKLERHRVPHLLSVILTTLILLFIVFLIIVMMAPMIQEQILILIDQTPAIITWMQDTLVPYFRNATWFDSFKETIASSLPKASEVLNTMLKSSYTIIGTAVGIVLIPIVFFYMLRDWDVIIANLVKVIPKSSRPAMVKLGRECSEILSQFFRGQFLVMLALACIYGVGLTLIGLKLGLMIGVIGGLLSIVPYLGSGFVLISSVVASLIQFGTSWDAVIPALTVFLIGQGLEGYVLTPYLVGERLGLHPVAVIFAVLAGGTLFGFFGVLLALPVSAVIVVLLRHFRERYVHE